MCGEVEWEDMIDLHCGGETWSGAWKSGGWLTSCVRRRYLLPLLPRPLSGYADVMARVDTPSSSLAFITQDGVCDS